MKANLGLGAALWLSFLGPLVAATARPNFVFFLTDDQDTHMRSVDYMPLLQKHVASKGATLERHYCTSKTAEALN